MLSRRAWLALFCACVQAASCAKVFGDASEGGFSRVGSSSNDLEIMQARSRIEPRGRCVVGGVDERKAVSQGVGPRSGLYVGKQVEAQFSGIHDLPMSSSDSNSSLISSPASDWIGNTREVGVECSSGDLDVSGVGSCFDDRRE